MNYEFKDITFGITCFERPKELHRLLISIYRYFEQPNVLVVCDSKNQNKEQKVATQFPEASFIFTEYDVGLSRKRNIIMNHAKTELILILEEDFIFQQREGLELALETMNKDNLDLVAGRVDNKYDFDLTNLAVATKKIITKFDFSRLKLLLNGQIEPINFYGTFKISANILWVEFNKSSLLDKDQSSFDLYPNFFIVKKSILIQLNGWQPESLKVREHIVFFVRLYELKIKSKFIYSFNILHRPKKRWTYVIRRLRKQNTDLTEYINYKILNDV